MVAEEAAVKLDALRRPSRSRQCDLQSTLVIRGGIKCVGACRRSSPLNRLQNQTDTDDTNSALQ